MGGPVAAARHVAGCWLVLGLLACQAPAAPARTSASAPASPVAPANTAPAAPAALQKVTFAITSPNMLFAIPWLAQESGIFARHGLDVEVVVVGGSPRAAQSLVAGDFDYVIAGISALLRSRAQGADTVLVATSSNIATSQKIMVMPQSGIRSLADLRGRTIGITQYGSEAHNFVLQALASVGLGPDDVQLLQLGASPQVAAALLSGGIDAGVNSGAAGLAAERAGAVTVVAAEALHILAPAGTVATTRRLIEQDRGSVLRFLRAYVEAIHLFKTDRATAVRLLQPHMGNLPLDEVEYLYDEVASVYQPLPVVREEAVQAVLDRDDALRDRGFKPGDFLDLSLLDEIEQSGFLATLYR